MGIESAESGIFSDKLSRKEESNRLTPNYSYSAMTREQAKEKELALQKISQRYFPGQEIKFSAGYFFFPKINKRLINEKDFRDIYEEAANPGYFQFPGHFPKEVKRSKEILAQEYKIHLMPQPAYVPAILDKIFAAINSDSELNSAISQVKVINDENTKREATMPSIVVYTQLGKENAQRALDKIYKLLKNYNDIGTGETPRFNQKVNNLIYYAQSGGGWKNNYINSMHGLGKDPVKNEIFESDFIHFKGDYKLRLPNEPINIHTPKDEKSKEPNNIFRTIRSEADLSDKDRGTIKKLRENLRKL